MWRPTHLHKKRGTTYEMLGLAKLQSNELVGEDTVLVVYRSQDGKLWARPKDEFEDGRFQSLGR